MTKIIFKKTDSKMDQVEYVDSEKCIAKLDNPKQGILPHDLIHALVESQLGIRGFTELIFEGKKPEFAMQADGEAWLSESMVEAIQGMLWSGKLDLPQFNDWVKNICLQRKVAPVEVTDHQFSELARQIQEVSNKWTALPVGKTLEVEWLRLK